MRPLRAFSPFAFLGLLAACSASSSSSSNDGGGGGSGDDAGGARNDGGSSSGDDAGAGIDATPTTYSNVVINFDDLATDTEVTDQYAKHLTFKSDPGVKMMAEDLIDIGQSPKNYMSAGGGSDVLHPLYVDFVKPVKGLRFKALGVTDTGTVAHIKIVMRNAAPVTVNLVGKGDSYTPVPVDLSTYTGVTRLEVVDITDSYGIVYDDFVFDFPQ